MYNNFFSQGINDKNKKAEYSSATTKLLSPKEIKTFIQKNKILNAI